MGREFWLTIDGMPDPPSGSNVAELHLNGCGAALEQPISPEESVRLAESFSWQATSPVPELDPEGRPAL